MKLILLTILALLAFAGNSILNRWALQDGVTGPATFAVIRLWAGIICLWVLIATRSGIWIPRPKPGGALSLLIYAITFSFAYVTLDAGAGALVLFGVVQITLFGWALTQGETVPRAHYIGAILAFLGLLVLFWPQPGASSSITGFGLMAIAGIAWGIYTALGKGAGDPTLRTAQNFAGAAILSLPFLLLFDIQISPRGVGLAIASGAITSGLGYAVWYAVLPQLRSSFAAILQLTVPIIAAVGGIAFFGESLEIPFLAAAVLVVGGTVIAIRG